MNILLVLMPQDMTDTQLFQVAADSDSDTARAELVDRGYSAEDVEDEVDFILAERAAESRAVVEEYGRALGKEDTEI